MSNIILPLADPHATLETVGGKGMSLAKLARAGLPVPGGFHITTDAYWQFIAENDLQSRILEILQGIDAGDPAAVESASRSINAIFAAGHIPGEIADAITAEVDRLEGVPVAVRSSATAEDLPGASFAGQQETYLNIRGAVNILEAVKKCWASLWTGRAIAYRSRQGISPDTVALAVVVQKLVFAEAAGVLFTANPINGKRDELMITAAWGLGEAIVAGAVTPDTLIVDKKTWKMLRRDTAEKQVMTIRTEHGTNEAGVPEAQKNAAVLTDSQAAELAKLGVDIESLYGMPMDIEWTWTKAEGFAIVQARPITALPVTWSKPNPKVIMYSRTSLAEHLPNAASPLFGTLGLGPINQATTELGEFLHTELTEGNYGYCLINGYVYMGFIMTWKLAWGMVQTLFTAGGPMFKKSTERWRAARESLANVTAEWEQKNLKILAPPEILEGSRVLMYAAGKYYTVLQTGTLPNSTVSEMIFTSVYNMVKSKEDPEAASLLFGLDSVALRAEKSLFDLGTWIREHTALGEFVRRTSSGTLVDAIKDTAAPEGIPSAAWGDFKARFAKHLEAFGRTSYEFDFVNPTPAETPVVVLDAVKMYADGKGSNPYTRQNEAAERREQVIQKLRKQFKIIPNGLFNKIYRWAIDTGPVREDSLADMGMAHPIVRRLLGELGQQFTDHGAIKQADDIYWLVESEVDDLAALLEQGQQLPDYSGKIPPRKDRWHKQMKLNAPPVIPEKSKMAKMIPWHRTEDNSNTLTGLAASAGKITGTARVLFGPEDFKRMKPGDVLVAVTTTPAWTPLFTMAAGIVTDIGGPLSHSSIVAREFGIPAVLATGNGTRRIQDGQMVTVDGSAGTVTLH